MKTKEISTVSFFTILKNAKRILKNPLPFHEENFEKYGDTFRIQLGFNKKVYVTRDPDLTKHILQKKHKIYHKSKLQTNDLGKYIGKGLLTSNGKEWLQQRRLIQPAFYKKKLENIVITIKNTIDRELQKIETNKAIEIYPLMSDLAFQVVAKSLFSTTNMGQKMKRLQYVTETVQTMLIKEIRQPYKKWWFSLNGDVRKHMELIEEARQILQEIIDDRRVETDEKDDLLDMLLKSTYEDGSSMTNKQLIDEILILFTAGHETTSNALAFTLFLLGKHLEIQEEVYKETSKSAEEDESLFQQISKYTYTKQCIEESMRLYPPAYFTDRMNIEDDEFGELFFSKGTDILISFYEIHRNKKNWKDPLTFNPDRFIADKKKDSIDCYFPFGAGPRMCIGNNFAMYEMILTMIGIVKKYQVISLQDEVEIKPLITLRPEKVKLKFLLR